MHWQLSEQNFALKHELSRHLGVTQVTSQVLINRGVTSVEAAKRFLHPSLQQLSDPYLLAGMDEAVSRIVLAITRNEVIGIAGDYDADGVTSTALLVRFFAALGISTPFCVPHRIEDGYGFHRSGVDALAADGVKLIVTVDTGSTAYDAIDYAASLGIDVVVTDHHEVPEKLPRAVAVINPKREDSRFPFRKLAGVGVAFNLAVAIRQRLREIGYFTDARPEPRLRDLLDLVAVGTVADVVPLLDENRLFVKYGLEELKRTTNKGLQALKIISGLEAHQISAMTVAFRIAPRINAAGRLDDASRAVKLLTTDNAEEAATLAQSLHQFNQKRQQTEEVILREVDSTLRSNEELKDRMGLVLAGEAWHPGVIGIVASRICDQHKKPVAVIAIEGDICRGSVRSVGEVNIVDVLKNCSDLLVRFGGHTHAAGFSVERSKIAEFAARFNEEVTSRITDDDRHDKIAIDAELEPSEVNAQLVSELELLEPFGEGNPEPTFALRELQVAGTKIVADKHLKLKFLGDMVLVDAIGFGMKSREVSASDVLDVAFIPQRDTWRGDDAVQIKLRDLKVR